MEYTIDSFSDYYAALRTSPETLIAEIETLHGGNFTVQGQSFALKREDRGGIERMEIVRRPAESSHDGAAGNAASWRQKLMFFIADNLFLRSGVRRMERALHSRDTVAAGFRNRMLLEAVPAALGELFPELNLSRQRPEPENPEPENHLPPPVCCLPEGMEVVDRVSVSAWAVFVHPLNPISADTIDRAESRIVGNQLVLVFRQPGSRRRIEFRFAVREGGDPDVVRRAEAGLQRLLALALGKTGSGKYDNLAELFGQFVAQTVEDEMPALLARKARLLASEGEPRFLPRLEAKEGRGGSAAEKRLLKQIEPAIRSAVDQCMGACRVAAGGYLAAVRSDIACNALTPQTGRIFGEFLSRARRIEKVAESSLAAHPVGALARTWVDLLALEPQQDGACNENRFFFQRAPGTLGGMLGAKPVPAEMVTNRLGHSAAILPVPPQYRPAAERNLVRYLRNRIGGTPRDILRHLHTTEFDKATASLFAGDLRDILRPTVPPETLTESERKIVVRLLHALRIGKTTLGALDKYDRSLVKAVVSGREHEGPLTRALKLNAMAPDAAAGAALLAGMLGGNWTSDTVPIEEYAVSRLSGRIFTRRVDKGGIARPGPVPDTQAVDEPQSGDGPPHEPPQNPDPGVNADPRPDADRNAGPGRAPNPDIAASSQGFDPEWEKAAGHRVDPSPV
ncbi:hypothetical protein [Cupriavidus sp. AU9028]|uniref:hypothetical protein n=1 Tax=Cupriavidus sp. AU9028 TaxID=2871157 RepID=UPI001C96C072|nr:hypothetical protein [Cupriavidus sp. AU9028]MBY4896606.1 hypothetical protein [Cupriavidus sp. AU9028]